MLARSSGVAAAFPLAAGAALAQTPPPAPTPAPAEDIQVVIKGGGERRLAVAVPPLYAPGSAALQAKVADPFTATLRSDLEYAGAFSVTDPAHYPTGYRDPTPPTPPTGGSAPARRSSSTPGPTSRATGSPSRRASGT